MGLRFLVAAEDAFDLLARMPEMGSVRRYHSAGLTDIRMWRIKGFEKILIFYRAVASGIEVVRVLHSARDIPALFEDAEG